MEKNKIYIRADGNAQMGLGHVIRSLALAEMLAPDYECHFLIRSPAKALILQIKAVCKALIILPEPNTETGEADYLNNNILPPKSIIVLDGYHFHTAYQKVLKNSKHKIVCIDDIHAFPYLADAIINHASGASSADYEIAEYTKLYLGLSYLLARRPFRMAAQNRVEQAQKENAVFVCFGGADPQNDTLSTLKQCEHYQAIEKCYVVVGSAYQYKAELNTFLEKSRLNITLLHHLSANQMVDYMQLCKCAITSPSTVAYEYLSVGGILFLKIIADNQVEVYNHAIQSGLAFPFDHFPTVNEASRIQALALQKQLLDGKQDKRLRLIFHDLLLKIRRARQMDIQLYFEWANEPNTRRQSFNSSPIPIEVHQKWFEQKLNSPDCVLYVCEIDQKPAGQVRLIQEPNNVTINYSVDKAYRGKGLGYLFLNRALHQFVEERTTREVHFTGFVKMENIASNLTFEKLGFKRFIASEYPDTFKYTKIIYSNEGNQNRQ